MFRASLVAATALAGCSVLTDFSGLTGSVTAPSANDAGAEASSDAAAATDSAVPDSAMPVDAGLDAPSGDAGSWAYIGSVGKTLNAGPITLSATSSVLVGDLVVVSCDSAVTSGTITLSGFSASALPTTTLLAPGPSYEAFTAWGIAKQQIDMLTVTATQQVAGQFIDCYIDTYRGGSAATLVDHYVTTGTGVGLVSCHPVLTVAGGVAYYMAARSNCAGTPVLPFVQTQSLNGNPTGDFVPADGTKVGTQLSDCSGSTGDWVCLMVSLSP